MLRDSKLSPTYSPRRTILQHATARALALGNDITAYGHSTQSVTNTARTYSNIPSLTSKTAVYPTEQLLVNFIERYTSNTGSADEPRKQRLSDKFIDTPGNRMFFWRLYRELRRQGISRRQIIESLK